MKVRFSHLSLSDRRKIERWRHAKLSPDEIARRLGRHRSTIFRELKRNHFHDSEIPKLSGYWCIMAQSRCNGRRTRRRKLVRDPGLRDQVERCLRAGWTPEQIAGRMRYECAPSRVCQRPSTAMSIPRKAGRLNSGVICPQGADGGAAIGHASARRRNSPLNSVSCSGQTSSRIARNSAIGKVTWFCSGRNADQPMSPR